MADDTDRYWTSSIASLSTPVVTPVIFPVRRGHDRLNWIAARARLVFGSYRRDDFADPEVFLRQIASILERYDDTVIEACTSENTGIQRTCKFPPSIAEFVEFIEEHIRRSTFTSQYDARSREQLRQRAEEELHDKSEPLEHRRQVVDRIQAELKAAGLGRLTKPAAQTWRRFSDDDIRAMYPGKPHA